jgi:hypothetical protein
MGHLRQLESPSEERKGNVAPVPFMHRRRSKVGRPETIPVVSSRCYRTRSAILARPEMVRGIASCVMSSTDILLWVGRASDVREFRAGWSLRFSEQLLSL